MDAPKKDPERNTPRKPDEAADPDDIRWWQDFCNGVESDAPQPELRFLDDLDQVDAKVAKVWEENKERLEAAQARSIARAEKRLFERMGGKPGDRLVRKGMQYFLVKSGSQTGRT